MNQAENVLNKLSDAKHRRKNVNKSLILCLEELSEYLDDLCKKEIKKNYKDAHLIANIFNFTDASYKESDTKQHVKCQLLIANLWLKDLVKSINYVKPTFYKAIKYKEHIYDFMFDVKPFVEYFEQKVDENFVFFQGGKVYNQMSLHIFQNCNKLYWLNAYRNNPILHRSAINLSVFTLRQSLELKFKRIIGISYISDEKFNAAKIRHDYFPNFIEKNLSLIDTNYQSIKEIINIYKWTNLTIHTGVLPYIWEPWYAINYSSKLFQPDSAKSNGSWSIYSGVKINDYEALKANFIRSFSKDYPKENWNYEFVKPEAVIL